MCSVSVSLTHGQCRDLRICVSQLTDRQDKPQMHTQLSPEHRLVHSWAVTWIHPNTSPAHGLQVCRGNPEPQLAHKYICLAQELSASAHTSDLLKEEAFRAITAQKVWLQPQLQPSPVRHLWEFPEALASRISGPKSLWRWGLPPPCAPFPKAEETGLLPALCTRCC